MANAITAASALKITAPAEGTVVHPGEKVKVEVMAVGDAPNGVIIIGTDPIGLSEELSRAPYNFTIAIPLDITPHRYHLSAHGYIMEQGEVKTDSVAVDVERADSPVSLHAEPQTLLMSAQKAALLHEGHLQVSGTFADGKTYILTWSTLTTFVTENSAVATVRPSSAAVTAVAPGSTKIVITNGNAKVAVPVKVVAGGLP